MNNPVKLQEIHFINEKEYEYKPTSIIEAQPELAECLLVHPEFDEHDRYPFQFETIRHYQQNCQALKQKLQQFPEHYKETTFGTTSLICYRQDNEDKICLTAEILPKVITWYHEATAHVEGISRMEQNLKRHFYHPRMHEKVKEVLSSCVDCQKYKRGSRQYGHLAPRDTKAMPWQEIHCDTIGPWKIELRARTLEFKALTVIDPATNLIEINPLITKTASEVADAVENNWISRYPRPMKCVTDGGPEFGQEFVDMIKRSGITYSCVTSRNPQGNSIVERIHQAVGNVLRIVVKDENPRSPAEGRRVIEKTLATAMHACRCATNGTIGNLSAGALAFHRDMFMDIPLIADILTLQKHRQGLVDKRLLKANASRVSHDFRVGEQVLKKKFLNLSDKLAPAFEGPYEITRVHTNGTVTLRIRPNVVERINIRRVKPFIRPPN